MTPTIPTIAHAALDRSVPGAGSVSTRALIKLIVFLGLHVPLALAMHRSAAVTTAHAVSAIVIGLWWTGWGKDGERLACLTAYITGSEVLWRMNGAQLFWELGKYAVAAFLLLGLIRMRGRRVPGIAVAYLALLLPSALLTFSSHDFSFGRQLVSFNLSGPLCLCLSVCFFSNLRLTTGQVGRVFAALTGPAVGIAVVAIFNTMQFEEIHFSESNMITSGGFGPNQVSSVLGLAAYANLLYIFIKETSLQHKAILFTVAVFLGVFSAFTFSRGGIYGAALSLLAAAWYLMRNRQARTKLILAAAILFALVTFLILPRLDDFTGGAFSARYRDTNLTHRDSLARSDLNIWLQNPLLGVGPGRARYHRTEAGGAAHTEFSRLPAEHGAPGIIAILLLGVMALGAVRKQKGLKGKALAASLLCWSLLYMTNAAMRIAAPGFAFGLAFVIFSPGAAGALVRGGVARINRAGRRLKVRGGQRAPALKYRPDGREYRTS